MKQTPTTPFEFWGAYISSMQSLTEANMAMASRYWEMTHFFTGIPVDSAQDMVSKMTALSLAFSPVRQQSPCGVAPARKTARKAAPKRTKKMKPSPKDA